MASITDWCFITSFGMKSILIKSIIIFDLDKVFLIHHGKIIRIIILRALVGYTIILLFV